MQCCNTSDQSVMNRVIDFPYGELWPQYCILSQDDSGVTCDRLDSCLLVYLPAIVQLMLIICPWLWDVRSFKVLHIGGSDALLSKHQHDSQPPSNATTTPTASQFRYPALFIAHPPLLLLSLAFTCDHYKWHYSGQSRGDEFCSCAIPEIVFVWFCHIALDFWCFSHRVNPCSKVLVITPEDFTWSFLSSLSKNNECISAYRLWFRDDFLSIHLPGNIFNWLTRSIAVENVRSPVSNLLNVFWYHSKNNASYYRCSGAREE